MRRVEVFYTIIVLGLQDGIWITGPADESSRVTRLGDEKMRSACGQMPSRERTRD
jgi:hypothetical protein